MSVCGSALSVREVKPLVCALILLIGVKCSSACTATAQRAVCDRQEPWASIYRYHVGGWVCHL